MEEPTLEELIEITKREKASDIRDGEDARLKTDSFFSPHRPDWTPHAVNKRDKKSKPREISSKRPVPVGRDRCLGIGNSHGGRSVRNFDPRFEDHCGDLHEEHAERNFAFVNTLKAKYKRRLEGIVKQDETNERAARELNRLEQEDARQKAISRRKEILRTLRREEKEAVKRGKTPYFLKEKEIRRLELEAKFEDVKKKGGISKYIVKRRRRIAGKDRKLLPERREANQHPG